MASSRIFELRTYHAAPGKFAALERRFRDHTVRIFARMGMELVWLFLPTGERAEGGPLVYVLAFESHEDAAARWEAFRADPEWVAAKAASEADGPLLMGLESAFFEAATYSPLQ